MSKKGSAYFRSILSKIGASFTLTPEGVRRIIIDVIKQAVKLYSALNYRVIKFGDFVY